MTKPTVSEAEIQLVGPILQRLMWANAASRESLQSTFGVNVLPVNFYSNTPSIHEVKTSFEYTEPDAPYANSSVFDGAVMLQTLERLRPFAVEFAPDVDGDEAACSRFFWKNSQFSFCDAMSYYCFIRAHQPQTIVEIGAGFSTLVAIEAVARNGFGRIICVEPFPRPFLVDNECVELVRTPAQELDVATLHNWLKDGDFLFIDSTHTVKTGSDCLHIYLRLLPAIQRRLYVHAHDIYLPFGLPQEWLLSRQVFWTEQYLLLALLTDNPKAQALYGSYYHLAYNKAALDAMMHQRHPCRGGSFWFRYDGRSSRQPLPT